MSAVMATVRQSAAVALDFLIGSWTELPQDVNFFGRVVIFLFGGLRLVGDESVMRTARKSLWMQQWEGVQKWLASSKETLSERRQYRSSMPLMLFVGTFSYLVYDGMILGSMGCRISGEEHDLLGSKRLWYELVMTFAHWLVPQIMARVILEKPRQELAGSFRSLLMLENAAWLFFIIGDFLVRITLMHTMRLEANEKLTAGLVITEILYVYQVIAAFCLCAPCLAFQALPRNNSLSEVTFHSVFLFLVLGATWRTIQDVTCAPVEKKLMIKALGTFGGVTASSMQHFYDTHRFCCLLCVYLKGHLLDHAHIEPDVFMIAELFVPVRRNVCFICKFLLLNGTALGVLLMCWFLDSKLYLSKWLGKKKHWDVFGAPYVTMTWKVLLNSIFVVYFVQAYLDYKTQRREAHFICLLIQMGGLLGVLYYLYMFTDGTAEDEDYNWAQFYTMFADMICVVCQALLASDVICKRLMMSHTTWGCIFMLFFAVWSLADWLLLESYAQLKYLMFDEKKDTYETLPITYRLAQLGEFGAVESCLMQSIGWITHCLEGMDEHGHSTHGEEHDIYDSSESVAGHSMVSARNAESGFFSFQKPADGSSANLKPSRLHDWQQVRRRQSMEMRAAEAQPFLASGLAGAPPGGPRHAIALPGGSFGSFAGGRGGGSFGGGAPPRRQRTSLASVMEDADSSLSSPATASSPGRQVANGGGGGSGRSAWQRARLAVKANVAGRTLWPGRWRSQGEAQASTRDGRQEGQPLASAPGGIELLGIAERCESWEADSPGRGSPPQQETGASWTEESFREGPRETLVMQTTSSGGIVRPDIAPALFEFCAAGGGGRMGVQELRRYAILCGFSGSDREWEEEYKFLCEKNGWSPGEGLDMRKFQQLTDGSADSRFAISEDLRALCMALGL